MKEHKCHATKYATPLLHLWFDRFFRVVLVYWKGRLVFSNSELLTLESIEHLKQEFNHQMMWCFLPQFFFCTFYITQTLVASNKTIFKIVQHLNIVCSFPQFPSLLFAHFNLIWIGFSIFFFHSFWLMNFVRFFFKFKRLQSLNCSLYRVLYQFCQRQNLVINIYFPWISHEIERKKKQFLKAFERCWKWQKKKNN